MLVLSRKIGEKVCIGDNIVVTITEVKGNRVRLGIEAPESTRVMRSELLFDAEEHLERARISQHGGLQPFSQAANETMV